MTGQMLQTQRQFVEYLGQVNALVAQAELDKSKDGLIKAISEQELLVPVVGGFSAGKSTALNAFLGESVLSVAITPETALATELRYTQGESYAEGVRENGEAQRLSLAEFGELKNRASEFSFARLYLNNEKLKAIAPLVLVDMPGFDSPLDAHNKAIQGYLKKGVFFIVLESVERGAVEASTQANIKTFTSLKRDFVFCLSKTDAQPPAQVESIRASIASTLKASFGYTKSVFLLDDGDKTLDEVISQIESEKIFERLYKDDLKFDFESTKSSIQTKISTLQASKVDIKEALDEIENTIASIDTVRQNLAREQNDRAQIVADATLKAVLNALSGSINSLAQAAMSSQETMNRQINQIVQATLTSEFAKQAQSQIQDIIEVYKIELNDLKLASFNIDERWLENVLSFISNALEGIVIGVKDNSGLIDTLANGAQVIMAALAVKFKFLKPIAVIAGEVVRFIAGLFGAGEKEIDKAGLEAQILSSVQSGLKPELEKHAKEQISTLQENIAIALEASFKVKSKEIQAAQQEKEKESAELEMQINKLSQVSDKLSTLATQYLYA